MRKNWVFNIGFCVLGIIVPTSLVCAVCTDRHNAYGATDPVPGVHASCSDCASSIPGQDGYCGDPRQEGEIGTSCSDEPQSSGWMYTYAPVDQPDGSCVCEQIGDPDELTDDYTAPEYGGACN